MPCFRENAYLLRVLGLGCGTTAMSSPSSLSYQVGSLRDHHLLYLTNIFEMRMLFVLFYFYINGDAMMGLALSVFVHGELT